MPIEYQQEIWKKYHFNIDCIENILSLCPTCHRAIHHGTNEVKKAIITELYEKLLPQYQSCGFEISLDEVLKLYNVK